MLGYVAAIITTISFLPQAVQFGRRRNGTADISLVSYSIFLVGLSFWVAYGVEIMSYPVILANSCTGILVAWILVRGKILKSSSSDGKNGSS